VSRSKESRSKRFVLKVFYDDTSSWPISENELNSGWRCINDVLNYQMGNYLDRWEGRRISDTVVGIPQSKLGMIAYQHLGLTACRVSVQYDSIASQSFSI
jgi:hypothetical protein